MNFELFYDYEVSKPSSIFVDPNDYLTVTSLDELISTLDDEMSDDFVEAYVTQESASDLWNEIQKLKEAQA